MNYQLEQTGDQVQSILNQAPTTEQDLRSEITRSTNKDEQLETAIGNEVTRAEGAEGQLQTAIGNEKTRAEGVEGELQTAIGNEKTRAEGVEGGLRTDVDAINGKIPAAASSSNKLADKDFVNSSIATNTADFKGTYSTIEELQAVLGANANDYAFVIMHNAAGNTQYWRYKYVTGTGWVFEYALNNSSFTPDQWAAINSAITAALVAKLLALPTAASLTQQLNAIIASVGDEQTRAEGAEGVLRGDIAANATAIGNEKTRAEGAEGLLQTAIGNEKTRAEGAELVLQQNIDAEALLRGNADTTLQGEIDTINGKIPSAASSSNQLADKDFVNSSISTNTADFKGTYNSLQELEAVTANANDYGFVVATDAAGNTVYNRYKYVTGTGWVFEYALNNSSFTSDQWAAINSGITALLVAKLSGLPDATALDDMFVAITSLIPSAATSSNKLVDNAAMVAALALKQNTLTFDDAPTEDSANPVKSGGVYAAIQEIVLAITGLQNGKQDKLTFDAYPTAGSDNPVKSKGIFEKLGEKQATLVPGTNIDTTPTLNSNNPVTSGGVKAALDQKQNTLTFDSTPTTGSNNPVTSGGIKIAIDAEASRATGVESGLNARVSTNEADIAALQALYNSLQQSAPDVIEPTDTWPVANPSATVIYRVIDRVNTPPQYYQDYMWNGSAMVLMSQYNNAIDNVPTYNSQNLVKSGGVEEMFKDYHRKLVIPNVIAAIQDTSTIAADGTYTVSVNNVRMLNGFADATHTYLFLVKYIDGITDIARITTTGYSFDETLPNFVGNVHHDANTINYALITGYGSNASLNYKGSNSSEPFPQTFAKVALFDVTGFVVTDELIAELAKHFGESEAVIETSVMQNIPSYNLTAKADYLENTRMHNTGSIQTATGYTTTDFIPLDVNDAYKMIYSKYGWDIILFFDSSKAVIGGTQAKWNNYQIPNGSYYVRVCYTTTEIGSDSTSGVSQEELIKTNMVCIGESAAYLPYKAKTQRLISFEHVESWRKVATNALKNGYQGKIVDTFGDSITEARAYQSLVSRYFGCSVDVHGVGGSRVSGDGSTCFWKDERINTLNPKADYIVIMGGMNDSTSYTLGEVSDENFDTDTFVGAYNTTIHKIWHRYEMLENPEYSGVNQIGYTKDVHIILMTPTFRSGREAALKELSEAVIAIGKMWNIPVVDLYFQSNMGVQTIGIYWSESDLTHPNFEGQKQIASLLIGKMKEIEPCY